MPHLRTRIGTISLMALLVAACAPAAPTPTAAASATAAPSPIVAPTPTPAQATAEAAGEPAPGTFPGAATIGLAAAPDGPLYAIFGRGQSLYVARSDDGGRSFGPPALASGATQALVTPFERPTVAAGPGGAVAVSWLEQDGGRTTVWAARSSDGAASFGPPEQVALSGEFETTMARLAAPPPAVAVAWLQGGGLWLGRSAGDAYQLREVDGLVCECCQPAALLDGERLTLAYRNLEREAGVDTRDLFVAVSDDGGASFHEPARVSDEPWRVNACPLSGPALAAADGRLYVAWMDGRADTAQAGARGDLWVAASEDGGASFGPNVRVNPAAAGFHNLPALGAGPDGALHVAWEGHEGGPTSIRYSSSTDGGASFGAPLALATQDEERGLPRGAALAIGAGGAVYVAWIDRLGGHVVTLGQPGS
jgi:hypothetical protein